MTDTPSPASDVAYDTSSWSVGALYVVLILLTLVFSSALVIQGPQLGEVGALVALAVLWVVQLAFLCSTIVVGPLGDLRGERMIGSVETHISQVRSAKVLRTRPAVLVLRGSRTLAIAAPIDGYDDLIRRLEQGGVTLADNVLRRADLLRGRAAPRVRPS